MKTLLIALLGITLLVGAGAARAANEMVGPMRLHDFPVADVIHIYELTAGKKVSVTSDAKAVTAFLTIRLERIPKEEFLRSVEEALAKQAGIEIVHEPDGSISARKIGTKK